MENQKIIKKTEEYAKKTLQGEPTGHDWWHTDHVRRLALKIAEEEKADMFIVELAALLHDITDWKFSDKEEKPIKEFLEKIKTDKKTIHHVCDIIKNLSYKGAGVQTPMKTKEGKIVQDADRLDGIGAIGIARTFAYGGKIGRPIHNPNAKPVMHKTFEEYKKIDESSINHFYQKLLLLKDRLNTKTAKKMAEKRHAFIQAFLKEFLEEWNE